MRVLVKTLLMLGIITFAWACTKDAWDDAVPGVNEDIVFAAEEEGAANNLSFPVIWATEGEALFAANPLIFQTPVFAENPDIVLDGTDLWLQGAPHNTWTASTYAGTGWLPAQANLIDWGDNLEARSWKVNSVIRVEAVFTSNELWNYRHQYGGTEKGYNMTWVSGQGISEIWGTDQTTYLPTEATIYTNKAELVIQKVATLEQGFPLPPNGGTFTWDHDEHVWTNNGSVLPVYLGNTVYSAEINVKGKVIFGYNWFTKNSACTPGIYRITFYETYPGSPMFSLDGAQIVDPSDSPNEGGKHYVDYTNNITYIDIMLTATTGGGGGGNGGGGNGGGGNGGGGHGQGH